MKPVYISSSTIITNIKSRTLSTFGNSYRHPIDSVPVSSPSHRKKSNQQTQMKACKSDGEPETDIGDDEENEGNMRIEVKKRAKRMTTSIAFNEPNGGQ